MFIIGVVFVQDPRAIARDFSSFILAPVAYMYSCYLNLIYLARMCYEDRNIVGICDSSCFGSIMSYFYSM